MLSDFGLCRKKLLISVGRRSSACCIAALACAVLAVWFPNDIRGQTTIHVPADQPTIQAGIDVAYPGDTVLVAPGTYTENIDFKGKGITLTSGAKQYSEAASTIITAAHPGSVVVMEHGEPATAVLNGFTIQNGHSLPHSTTIENNGISIYKASPIITNNIITNNTGCGVNVSGLSAPVIQGNDIIRNIVAQDGGLVQCIGVTPVYSGGGSGIGIIAAGDVTIVGNVIEQNSANYGVLFSDGWAISINNASNETILIEGNTIRNNLTGALNVLTILSNAKVKLNLIQNLIYNSGRVVLAGDPTSSVIETNNTILDSGVASVVQAIAGSFGPSQIENNLFINPTDAQAAGLVCFLTGNSSLISFKNNDIFPAVGTNSNLYPPCRNLGTGNLFADPLFLNPAAGDFHTERTSPVVAAGDINASLIPPTDFDDRNRTVCGTIDMGVYEVHPIPPIALTSTPNPSVGGSSVTFTATVQGNCNIATGRVTFMDGTTPVATVTLDHSASAVFTTSSLTVGSHNITVTYPGDFNFDSSVSSILVQVVTGYPTATSLQVSPNPADAFQSINFSASVSSQFGVPTGTVSFFAGSTRIGTGTLNANGLTSLTNSTLGAGTYIITAVYSASPFYASSSSAAVTEVVNGSPTSTSLRSNPNPSSFGQAVTFTANVTAPLSTAVPTGTVTLQEGTSSLGSAALSATGMVSFSLSTLGVGSHTISAFYGGSPNYNASTSTTIVQVVAPSPILVTLTASPNPANVGETVALTASVSSNIAGLPVPGGTIVFADQFGLLGTVPLSSGKALLPVSSLGVGSHTITASFSNGGNYGNGVSTSIVEVIQNHDFTITLSPGTVSVSPGQSTQINVLLSSIGSFTDTLSLSAGPLPTYAAVSFSASTVPLPAGGAASSVMSLTTAALPKGIALNRQTGLRGSPLSFPLAALAVLPILVRRRSRLAVLCTALVAVLLLSSSGCGSLIYTMNTVAPGTYVIPITATDPLTQVTHATNLTLVVTR